LPALPAAGDDVEDVFCLDFTANIESFGEVQTVDLIPGGSKIPVTRANRKQYVAAYLKWLLVDSVARQFTAFARGFHTVVSGPALDLMRPEELSLLVTGSKELDFEELQRGARYEEPYTPTHRAVKWLWEAVHALDGPQKKRFLAFVTGSDRSPIRGLADLRMVVQRAGPDSESLPTASTCFNTLLLPDYSSAEKMKRKLLKAIEESEGFGLK